MPFSEIDAREMNNKSVNSTNIVEMENLTVVIGANSILNNITFALDQGEFVAIVGANGSGKTTFLRSLAGLIEKFEGNISLYGQDLKKLTHKEIGSKVAIVPQTPSSTGSFSTLDIISMGRYPRTGRFVLETEQDQKLILEVMESTDTLKFSSRLVTELSGGERQRVFIARALAQEPSILLLDEPTANLDIRYQMNILDLARDHIKKGISVIAAIHDLSLAAKYADRIVLLHEGNIVADDLPEIVLTPENVKKTYGVSSLIYPDPFSGKITMSLRKLAENPINFEGEMKVHLICGGGSGSELMYILRDAGIVVTAGPLGSGDTDRMVADILGIEYIPTLAFQAVSDEILLIHQNRLLDADLVIFCNMPIGPNNLKNLEAAGLANNLLIMGDEALGLRDLTNGEASEKYAQLVRDNARVDINEILQVIDSFIA